MKSILIITVAMIGLIFSGCYVEEGRHRPHHHHGTSIEIRSSDNTIKKDSIQSPAMGTVDQKDSLNPVVNPGAGKQ